MSKFSVPETSKLEDKHLRISCVQTSQGLYPWLTHGVDFISLSFFGDFSICIEVLESRDSILLAILMFCSWQSGHGVKLQSCFLCGCEQLGLIRESHFFLKSKGYSLEAVREEAGC